MWIADEQEHPKIAKLGQLGTRSGSRDILLNFGTSSISEERLKIQTSNSVCRLTTRDANQKFEKIGEIGRRPGSRDLPLNFGTTSISTEQLKIQTSNFVRRLRTKRSIQKMLNYVNC